MALNQAEAELFDRLLKMAREGRLPARAQTIAHITFGMVRGKVLRLAIKDGNVRDWLAYCDAKPDVIWVVSGPSNDPNVAVVDILPRA